jgi:hypothetical protein
MSIGCILGGLGIPERDDGVPLIVRSSPTWKKSCRGLTSTLPTETSSSSTSEEVDAVCVVVPTRGALTTSSAPAGETAAPIRNTQQKSDAAQSLGNAVVATPIDASLSPRNSRRRCPSLGRELLLLIIRYVRSSRQADLPASTRRCRIDSSRARTVCWSVRDRYRTLPASPEGTGVPEQRSFLTMINRVAHLLLSAILLSAVGVDLRVRPGSGRGMSFRGHFPLLRETPSAERTSRTPRPVMPSARGHGTRDNGRRGHVGAARPVPGFDADLQDVLVLGPGHLLAIGSPPGSSNPPMPGSVG